jgi:Cytochrome c7 and related cytochrome c
MSWRRTGVVIAMMAGVLIGSRGRAEAQFGALVSPGPLTRAHADLEGVTKCESCHQRGRQVSAQKCLSCHKPVADRILRKVGVHRNVKADCVQCHVEHNGRSGELRPFDQSGFTHAAVTGFGFEGKHAPLEKQCAACHKGRSFLDAKPACASCHRDVHNGELGSNCQRCHSTRVDFKAAAQAFDHATTRFPLTGAHRSTSCASCHKGSSFTGLKAGSCATCHDSPHAAGTVTGGCTSCHTTAGWSTKRFDHSTTSFPLIGKHIVAACSSCHKVSPTKAKPAAGTCATCHVDPHKGEFKQDCKSCHDENGFGRGAFDHAASTTFALVDGHAKVECQACHKNVSLGGPAAKVVADFRGAKIACAACHADPHRTDLGTTCETCHSARTFRVTSFVHPRAADLFKGQHASVTCEKCHRPASIPATSTAPARVAMAGGRFTATPTACASCHTDVHLGQVGTDCQICHSVDAAKFAPDRFSHRTASFPLTGAHATVECAKCHQTETAVFPAGTGQTMRLKGIGTACATCHEDVHLGQVSQQCESCHSTDTFAVGQYAHVKAPKNFFVGPHLAAKCSACHRQSTERFPAGRGTAVTFKVSTTCITCHEDVHRGAMGPYCLDCHKLASAVLPPGVRPPLRVAAVSHRQGAGL